MEACTRAEI